MPIQWETSSICWRRHRCVIVSSRQYGRRHVDVLHQLKRLDAARSDQSALAIDQAPPSILRYWSHLTVPLIIDQLGFFLWNISLLVFLIGSHINEKVVDIYIEPLGLNLVISMYFNQTKIIKLNGTWPRNWPPKTEACVHPKLLLFQVYFRPMAGWIQETFHTHLQLEVFSFFFLFWETTINK